MKIRSGFVSNSSSSSFILIMPKDSKFIDTLDEKEKNIFRKILSIISEKDIKLNDIDYIVYNGLYQSEDLYYDLSDEDYDLSDEDAEDIEEILQKIFTNLNKEKNHYTSNI